MPTSKLPPCPLPAPYLHRPLPDPVQDRARREAATLRRQAEVAEASKERLAERQQAAEVHAAELRKELELKARKAEELEQAMRSKEVGGGGWGSWRP